MTRHGSVQVDLLVRWWLRPAVVVLTAAARVYPHHALGDALLFVVRRGICTKARRAR